MFSSMSIEEKKNQKIFANEVDKYDSNYWRSDEEAVVNGYFVDSSANLLVAGCGAGRTLPTLLQKGFTITGIDVVPEMIDVARRRYKNVRLDLKVMDAQRLQMSEITFKYVFFPFHGIDYICPDIYVAVKEFARVLRPDGIFVFSSHNRFYLKKLHRFFDGPYANYRGLTTYRTTPLDYFRLKKYFRKVKFFGRTQLQDKKNISWKDWCYRIFPIFDKTTYFICIDPRKNDLQTK